MFGFWKGMAWQIASLASLVVSYFAALRFSEQLAPMFGDQAPLNRFVAMLAIYIVHVVHHLDAVSAGVRRDRQGAARIVRQAARRDVRLRQGRAAVRGDHVLRGHACCRRRKARRSWRRSRAGTSSPCSTNRTRSSRRRFTRSSIRISTSSKSG